jgi:hypothetical protein
MSMGLDVSGSLAIKMRSNYLIEFYMLVIQY